jgi:hypothetical protein
MILKKHMMRAGIALAMAVVICGVAAGPVFAKHDHHGWKHRGHGWHDQGWRDQGWHGYHKGVYYSPRRNVYAAPPPIVYTPYRSPGIELNLPSVNIR